MKQAIAAVTADEKWETLTRACREQLNRWRTGVSAFSSGPTEDVQRCIGELDTILLTHGKPR